MDITQLSSKDFSPEVQEWALNKLAEDRAFIEHRAKFGAPLVKAIATLILEMGQEEKGVKNDKWE